MQRYTDEEYRSVDHPSPVRLLSGKMLPANPFLPPMGVKPTCTTFFTFRQNPWTMSSRRSGYPLSRLCVGRTVRKVGIVSSRRSLKCTETRLSYFSPNANYLSLCCTPIRPYIYLLPHHFSVLSTAQQLHLLSANKLSPVLAQICPLVLVS